MTIISVPCWWEFCLFFFFLFSAVCLDLNTVLVQKRNSDIQQNICWNIYECVLLSLPGPILASPLPVSENTLWSRYCVSIITQVPQPNSTCPSSDLFPPYKPFMDHLLYLWILPPPSPQQSHPQDPIPTSPFSLTFHYWLLCFLDPHYKVLAPWTLTGLSHHISCSLTNHFLSHPDPLR